MSKTSELWWVSVGGAQCEPAQVVTEVIHLEGDVQSIQTVFTIGCGDGTSNPDGNGITLVQRIPEERRPLTPAAQKAQALMWAERRAADMRRGVSHGYRSFP